MANDKTLSACGQNEPYLRLCKKDWYHRKSSHWIDEGSAQTFFQKTFLDVFNRALTSAKCGDNIRDSPHLPVQRAGRRHRVKALGRR